MAQLGPLLLAVVCAATCPVASRSVVRATEPFGEEVESLYHAEQWKSWKVQYGRSYKSEEEEQRRYGIWLDNFNYIENHNRNASQHGYTLKMNSLGDMVSEMLHTQGLAGRYNYMHQVQAVSVTLLHYKTLYKQPRSSCMA